MSGGLRKVSLEQFFWESSIDLVLKEDRSLQGKHVFFCFMHESLRFQFGIGESHCTTSRSE